MKIKEAIEIINGTETVHAEMLGGEIVIYSSTKDIWNWFLRFPTEITDWGFVAKDWICLVDVDPKDLAHVMDVVQRLLDTPVKERFPEKKYRLRWIDDELGKTFLGFNNQWTEKIWSTYGDPTSNTIFTESELEQLKKDNPRFAPAIDVMKEPAEAKND